MQVDLLRILKDKEKLKKFPANPTKKIRENKFSSIISKQPS